MLRARRMLYELGIDVQDIWIGEYESREKQARVRKVLDKFVKPDDWVVHSDADEFHGITQDLDSLVNEFDQKGINAVQGPLIDRISASGALKDIELDSPVWEQFPVECNVGGKILGLAKREKSELKNKMLMYKGYLRANHGSGKISREFDDKAHYFRSDIKIHHFKWTADVLERLHRRVRIYKKIKYDWWTESQKFITYYKKYGRIRIEDVK